MDDDLRLMRAALRLARRGRGRVEPNPMVGCVLARAGRIVAQGWHQRFGGPHAEVLALRDAQQRGVDVSACDLYVTLEPCAHHGKTPPCAQAVAAARPAHVVAAMIDPFPQVAGRGLAMLQQAGLAVRVGVGRIEAQQLNEPFLKRVATGLPWVVCKWAQTLDGRIASRGGDSRWISSEASRRIVHQWRGHVDAVMVGIGTVLADDPRLTARGVRRRRLARRVVVDPHLRLPMTSALIASLREDRHAPPLTLAVRDDVLAAQRARADELRALGVELFALDAARGHAPDGPGHDARGAVSLALDPLLRHLGQAHAATNVLVEGGARLTGALLAQGLVDQVLAFVAPRLLADEKALPAAVGLAVPSIAAGTTLALRSLRRIGDDVMLDYRVTPVGQADAAVNPQR